MVRRHPIVITILFLSSFSLFHHRLIAQETLYDAIEAQEILLFDDFTSFSNNWLLGIEEGSWTETIEEGKLFFQSHTDTAKEDLIPVFIDQQRDFEIETVIQFVEGKMNGAYGLQWGKSTKQSKQFDFFITADGRYTIDKYDGDFIDYVKFTPLEHVNRYAPNKLTFRKIADTSYFFINEHFVYKAPFESFYGNQTGIQVAGRSSILIEYFKVAYLDQRENAVSKILFIDYEYNIQGKSYVRGTPILLKVHIKNAGNLKASNLKFTCNLPEQVSLVNCENVHIIPAGEMVELTAEFFTTQEYAGNHINVTFDIEGADISNAEDILFRVNLDSLDKESPDKSLIQTYSRYRGEDPLKGLNIAKALQDAEVGNYYALIIGIDKFTGDWKPLQNAVNDARSIQQILADKYNFDKIISLYNEQATRENILQNFEWLMNTLTPRDNLLIYYAGHGYYNDQMRAGFWVPVDATRKQMLQYISNDQIRSFLSGIRSRHTLLVSDACFSGDIFRGKTLTIPYENSTKYYHKVYSLSSRKALTSGGIEPVQDGGREGHSVFGYYVIKALKSNKEQYLDGGELFNQILIPVMNNSEQTPEYNAVHNTGDEGGQFVFISK